MPPSYRGMQVKFNLPNLLKTMKIFSLKFFVNYNILIGNLVDQFDKIALKFVQLASQIKMLPYVAT